MGSGSGFRLILKARHFLSQPLVPGRLLPACTKRALRAARLQLDYVLAVLPNSHNSPVQWCHQCCLLQPALSGNHSLGLYRGLTSAREHLQVRAVAAGLHSAQQPGPLRLLSLLTSLAPHSRPLLYAEQRKLSYWIRTCIRCPCTARKHHGRHDTRFETSGIWICRLGPCTTREKSWSGRMQQTQKHSKIRQKSYISSVQAVRAAQWSQHNQSRHSMQPSKR